MRAVEQDNHMPMPAVFADFPEDWSRGLVVATHARPGSEPTITRIWGAEHRLRRLASTAISPRHLSSCFRVSWSPDAVVAHTELGLPPTCWHWVTAEGARNTISSRALMPTMTYCLYSESNLSMLEGPTV